VTTSSSPKCGTIERRQESACPAVVVLLTTLAKPQPRATAGGICRGVHARFEG
jgi:hypothetical protein